MTERQAGVGGLGRLGKMLIIEGADPKVYKMFYREVTQTVLLFGLETWVISAAMDITVEGTHTGFLIHIMGNWLWCKADSTWSTQKLEEVQEAEKSQS